MVITVFADIVEVLIKSVGGTRHIGSSHLESTYVVFTTSTNTLLRVDSALELAEIRLGIDRTQEDGLVLVHTRICEE